MEPVTDIFREKALKALNDTELQEAMRANRAFSASVRASVRGLKEFNAMREQAKAVKNHTLDNLGAYLESYEREARKNDIHVYWAGSGDQARNIVTAICRSVSARTAACGRSMIGSEINLPRALEEEGIIRYETDLAEYILQLAGGESPSHVSGPAIHKTQSQIRELFYERHKKQRSGDRDPAASEDLLAEAREILRDRFLSADIGIIGANFLIAENGANILVTNEGNGDLSTLLPKTTIVLASIEKVLPRMADASLFLELLCTSATGQNATAYQSFYLGPKPMDANGNEGRTHVVLVDNGRSEILGSGYWPILRCVRCGACMDNCPVYGSIGGHPYGWIYPGPMGIVWSALLLGREKASDLAHACSLNGRCNEVCPMGIPLKELIHGLRRDQWETGAVPLRDRAVMKTWEFAASSPGLYRWITRGISLTGSIPVPGRGIFDPFFFSRDRSGAKAFPLPENTPFNRLWQTYKKDRQEWKQDKQS